MGMKLSDGLNRCVAAVWSFLAAVVVFLLFLFQSGVDYNRKVSYPVPVAVQAALGVGLLLTLTLLYRRFSSKVDGFFEDMPDRTVGALCLILFLVQGYVFYNIFFYTGWDSQLITDSALHVLHGEYDELKLKYYSMYPNNLLLIWLYTQIFRVNELLGDASCFYFAGILVQCAGASLTGYLLFRIVSDLTCKTCAYAAWLVYVIHIALSPWISILYSDGFALCIPIAVLRIYQTGTAGKHGTLKWGTMGALAYLGYKIKPQAVIVMIAILAIEALELLKKPDRRAVLARARHICAAAVCAFAAMTVCVVILFPSLHIPLDNNNVYGSSHYLMMGLNTRTDGTFSAEDVAFSGNYGTPQERRDANLQQAKQRLSEMGIDGLGRHLLRKTLVNYGDGTYAWGQEGSFYREIRPENNSLMSPLLRSIYYSDGAHYGAFPLTQNIIWVTLLFCSCGIGLYVHFSLKTDPVVSVIALSLIGLAMFETLFEARARYQFLYGPFYIMAAVIGWIGFTRWFRGWKSAKKKTA